MTQEQKYSHSHIHAIFSSLFLNNDPCSSSYIFMGSILSLEKSADPASSRLKEGLGGRRPRGGSKTSSIECSWLVAEEESTFSSCSGWASEYETTSVREGVPCAGPSGSDGAVEEAVGSEMQLLITGEEKTMEVLPLCTGPPAAPGGIKHAVFSALGVNTSAPIMAAREVGT